MRAAAHQQAQEAAHRLLQASIADATARAAVGRPRSLPAAIATNGGPGGQNTSMDRAVALRRGTGSSAGSLAPSNVSSSPLHGAGAALVSRASTPSRPPLLRTQRPPSAASSSTAVRAVVRGALAPEAELVLDAGEEATEVVDSDKEEDLVADGGIAGGRGRSSGRRVHRQGSRHQICTAQAATPDALDNWMLEEELRKTAAALARATAAQDVVDGLDLPGLAALRSELNAAHAMALERIDDRRVALQVRQAASQEGPEPGRCVACWVKKADRVLLPCRHLCVCGGCLQSCLSKCPVCRTPMVDSIEVYSSA